MSLQPYTGPWDLNAASHLFRRTVFGMNKEFIESAISNGLNSTLDALLADVIAPAPPINYKDLGDASTPIGDSWVSAVHNGETRTRNFRFHSLAAWQLKNAHEAELSIMPKMLGFWHNHFPIERVTVNDPRFLYKYWETLRRNALGNFQTMVEEITVDPAMLRYLDGRSNTRRKPNENYARELLELFSIGKGPIVGSGDYTNYTEDDVLAIARIMTGWADRGYNSQTIGDPFALYTPNNHDTTTKTLSHRFGSVEVVNNGEDEYKDLIDIVFQQDEVSRFICRKLYRYFVATDIDSSVESEIIEPLAQALRDQNYNIKPVLKILLESEHFFQQREVVGGIISNPIEFLFNIYNTVDSNIDEVNDTERYHFWYRIFQQLSLMQMVYFSPPDVAGWQAYYLEPQFSELWINSVTIKRRMSFIQTSLGARGWRADAERIVLDLLSFIEGLSNPRDPNTLIKELADLFYPMPLSDDQITHMKDIFIPGLPDYEWTVEYDEYLQDPTNTQARNAVLNRLNDLFGNLLVIPEFQVI